MDNMPEVIRGFTHTEYLTVFIAIIFAYVGAEYFQGWGTLVRNRKVIKSYWQHLLWTFFAFATFIQNWWGIWPRTQFITTGIYFFFFSLVPILLFYLISVILFPDFNRLDQSVTNMKDYFYKNTRWFFSLLAVYFAFTIAASFIYPDLGDVFVQNLTRGAGIVLALSAAYFHQSQIMHIFLLIVAYAALFRFFIALAG
jgi:hypothetical protein